LRSIDEQINHFYEISGLQQNPRSSQIQRGTLRMINTNVNKMVQCERFGLDIFK